MLTSRQPNEHEPARSREDACHEDGVTLRVIDAYRTQLRGHGLDSPDGLFSEGVGERLDKPGLPTWRQRWRVTLADASGPRVFYLKRFTDPPYSARREVRRSGTGALTVAGLEWAWLHRLADAGIPSARPVAVAEECRGGREIRSAILTEAVTGQSLERWAEEWRNGNSAAARGVAAPLVKLVARLHSRGYVHRDLYFSHVFYDPDSPPEDSLRLIDLQRMFQPKRSMRRWIVKDLAALNFSAPRELYSRADRLAWLKCYLGVGKLDGSARRLAYQVIGKTLHMQRRERRRRIREHIA